MDSVASTIINKSIVMSNQRHVLPHPDGGWQVKKDGSERASSRHRTKDEAVQRAREQAKALKEELVVHNLDGTIAYRNSYGNDPRSSKG